MFHDLIVELLDCRVPKRLDAKVRSEGTFLLVRAGSRGQPPHRLNILNQTASVIYEMCDGKTSVGAIIKRLAQRYSGVPNDRIRQDVYQCLAGLVRRFVIAWTSDSRGTKDDKELCDQ